MVLYMYILNKMVLYMYIVNNFLVTSFSLPFSELSLVGLALTWLTNHRPSVLCLLVISEMTSMHRVEC